LSSIAEEHPSRAEVLPVTMRPSGSSIAEAGSPEAAAAVARRQRGVILERIG